jgi:hypothetical protein
MDLKNYEYNQHVEKLKEIREHNIEKSMTDRTCDICGSKEPDNPSPAQKIIMFMTFNMCPACIEKEKQLQAESKALENERVKKMQAVASQALANAKKIDDNIRYNGDVYNAAVVSIVDLEKAINADETIAPEQRYFMLANAVNERIAGFSKRIFELKNELNNEETTQVVHQRKLNELAEKLTKEERDKLKIIAINYKPQLSKDKPAGVKIPKLGPKSENLALVLKDYPKMNIDDAKLAALYLDKMNRTAQVMTTADAVAFVNSVK